MNFERLVEFPVLQRLLGTHWLLYMLECERLRPKVSYIGDLAELEESLEFLERNKANGLDNLIEELKKGIHPPQWEYFEHGFATAKEAFMLSKSFEIQLFPKIRSGDVYRIPDIKVRIPDSPEWTYCEVKTSPYFKDELQFMNFEDLVRKRFDELDFPPTDRFYLFVVNSFELLRFCSVDMFVKFLLQREREMRRYKLRIYPLVYSFPDNKRSLLNIYVFDPQSQLRIPVEEKIRVMISTSFKVARRYGDRYFFMHDFKRPDVGKRLRWILKKSRRQVPGNAKNVIFVYGREAVFGDITEVITALRNRFSKYAYPNIQAIVFNLETHFEAMEREVFRNPNVSQSLDIVTRFL